MDFNALAPRFARVREEIAAIQARAGVSGAVRIVGVTKGHPVEAVSAAAAAGLEAVGENRVQEALGKQDELGDLPIEWHMIGHVQTNKAKLLPGRFHLVHSIDSTRLAKVLARAVERRGSEVCQQVLVQVNIAGEEQKGGCPPDELGAVLEEVESHATLEVRGLMTMAPYTDDERVHHRVFAALRELRDRYRSDLRPLSELSMGMSGDYRAAVAEGATLLRLGTVLFGERPQ